MEAVAAMAPCREEKNVAMRAGSAEPVKIPVIFYARVSVFSTILLNPQAMDDPYIYESEVNFDAMKHSGKSGHKGCETCDKNVTRT